MMCAPCVGSPTRAGFSNISANAYTTPWLSVRIAQPLTPNSIGPRPPVPAGVTCLTVQLLPASVDTPIWSGAGKFAGRCWPRLRNCTEQTYTFPKNGLVPALSAQICSLSFECRLSLIRRDDHRRQPATLRSHARRSWVVETRDGHGCEPVEDRVREDEVAVKVERRRQVRVVNARPVGPWMGAVDLAVRSRRRSDGERRITKRDEIRFEIPRQRVDRPRHAVALRRRVRTRRRLPAAVGGLSPGIAAVEREVDARDADSLDPVPAGDKLGCRVFWARLLVDQVVGPGDDDVRMVRVDRDCRFVLMAPRHRCANAGNVGDASAGCRYGDKGAERGGPK